ncbi:MAG: MraY family glycosyltransferase [Planctomycetota bacterium]|jgi:UDP-GlcNAc:undecaprenyl-phosphate GlcNAc-1-phosphate transferase
MLYVSGLELSPTTFTAVAGVSSLASGLLCYLLRGPARQIGLVARHRRDRFGTGDIPLIGGIAMAGGIAVAMLALRPAPALRPLAAALLFFGVGLADDFLELKPGAKFGAQAAAAIAAALLLVGTGAHVGIAVLVLLLLVNASNYIDNMDALLPGVALTQALALVLAASGDNFGGAVTLWALPGVLFLTLPPARVYLGDSGSHLVGALLGCHAIGVLIDPAIGVRGDRVIPLLLLFAVPLADVATVTVSRLRRHRPILRGGTDHLSHRLVRSGMSVPGAVGLLVLASAVCGIASLLMFYSS